MMFRMLFGAGAFDHIFGDIGKAFSVDEDATEEQVTSYIGCSHRDLCHSDLSNANGTDKLAPW